MISELTPLSPTIIHLVQVTTGLLGDFGNLNLVGKMNIYDQP